MEKPAKREQLASRLGFLLISAGCAIGLGNVWRFPFITGEYGGACVLRLFSVCQLMVMPVMICEFAIGRASRLNLGMALGRLEPRGTKWHKFSWLNIVGIYTLLMFYTTICGWIVLYTWYMFTGTFEGLPPDAVGKFFGSFTGSAGQMTLGMSLSVLCGAAVCFLGLQNGVERIVKFMMAGLFIILVILAVHSMTLPGAPEGLSFYLKPDLEKFRSIGFFPIASAALNQAFFTLSVGVGSMCIFGSYISKEHSLPGEVCFITGMDFLVALIAGLIIFPACFTFGVHPSQGPGLVFVALPNIFAFMENGRLWGTLFFVFMSFAALTTVIAVFENMVSYFIDRYGMHRRRAVVVNAILLWLLSRRKPTPARASGCTACSGSTCAGSCLSSSSFSSFPATWTSSPANRQAPAFVALPGKNSYLFPVLFPDTACRAPLPGRRQTYTDLWPASRGPCTDSKGFTHMFNKMRLLTPGPTPLPERVRLALARDMIHHRKSDFHRIMNNVEEKLKLLFGTTEPVMPLACSGSGAMTAAVYSLFKPGETVITVNAGKFGERWGQIAKSHGLKVVEIVKNWGEAVSAREIEETIRKTPEAKGVLIQMSETSTGVLHPIESVAAVTRATDVLLIVDGISGVGLSPCPMDKWGIDCLLTGSQKGLMVPPGLAFIALSERAWKRCEDIEPGCFYFDLPAERKKLAKGETHFTTPVNLICGLEESLSMIFENGLDAIYRKQWALTMLCRHSAKALGLELLAKDNFAWGVTSILLPDGLDGTKIVKDCADKYGVYMAGGQDQLKGRIVRVGHMGWVDWADVVAGMYALNRCIIDRGGFCGSRDFLEQGLAAYRKALELEPGTPVPYQLHD